MSRSPFELMESAWAARRASFELPDPEQSAALDSVRSDLERAAELLRESEDPVSYAQALHLRAHVELDMGNLDRAGKLWTTAVAVLRKANAPLQLAHKVRHLGDLEFRRDHLDAASAHYSEALGLYRTIDHPDELDFANAVNRMALLKERLGDAAEARRLWSEARERYARLDLEEGVREAEEHLTALG